MIFVVGEIDLIKINLTPKFKIFIMSSNRVKYIIKISKRDSLRYKTS